MATNRITVGDINGIVGIVPTPATEDAARWDADQTVDLDETAKMVEMVVAGGTDVLLTNGTFGECATLTGDELYTFVDTVVQTVGGRIPVFAGATTLNTRDTVARGRKLAALGVDGLFVGRPMWLPLDEQQLVQYYRDVAEAVPEMALIVYDNPGAFKGKISSRAYQELASIPQVVAAKHIGLLLGGGAFIEDQKAVGNRIRLLPLENDWHYAAQLFPDEVTACWSGNVVCGAAPLMALKAAVGGRDWTDAAAIATQLEWALEPLFPDGNFELFMRYSIQIDNAEFAAAGLINPGPTRPPYQHAPERVLESGRECGRRWRALHDRYSLATADVALRA
ncbi:MAG TPA: dihydrodipicolinate synthase family protein [Acidimicrobiales bacterium]|nr:dihydrodipicolinate synthase family protein [Acidimicrobiales bacterium]